MFFAEDFDIEEALKMSYFEDGLEQGEHKKAIETARALLSLGVNTVEQIAAATGLSLAEVQELESDNNVTS